MTRLIPALFFAFGVLLTLVVSIPATYDALRLWHGPEFGVLALIVFEFGAVGAKLVTLALPHWSRRLTALTVALLLATTGANYAHGYDLAQVAQAAPTLAALLAHPAGAVLATLAAAAVFPVLLYVFLAAFVAEARRLVAGRDVLARARRAVATVRRMRGKSRQVVAHLATDLAAARQAVATQQRRAAELERDLAAARRELASRPPPEEVEVVYVARYRLTWQQLEQVVRRLAAENGVSLTTIRRRVAELEGEAAE